MPQVMISTGTSDQPETAYLNALGSVVGPMNDSAESRIVSRSVEQTPNGFVVTVEVVLYSEEDLLDMEPDREGEDTGGQTGAVSHDRRTPMHISDYMYLQSRHELEHGAHALQDMAQEEMMHPEHNLAETPAPPVEAEFEEAAHPSDASYVHSSSDNDNEGGRIVTELAEQEIEDAVRHDVLSAGVVIGSDRAPSSPSVPEDVLDGENFQKDVKKRPPSADNLDLVA